VERAHSERIMSIGEIRSNNILLTASEENVMKLWSRQSLQQLAQIPVKQTVRCLLVVHVVAEASDDPSSKQETLWTADVAGKMNIWHVKSKGECLLLKSENIISDAIFALCQHRDGAVMVAAETTLLKLHPKTHLELHRRPHAHTSRINALVAFEDVVISASTDVTICIWNYKLDALCTLRYHRSKINTLCLAASVLVSGSFDKSICFINLQELLATLPKTVDRPSAFVVDAHTDSINSLSYCCGKLWSGSVNGQLNIWDIGISSLTTAGRSSSPGWTRSRALSRSSSGRDSLESSSSSSPVRSLQLSASRIAPIMLAAERDCPSPPPKTM